MVVVIEYRAYSSQDRKYSKSRPLEEEIGLLTAVPVEQMNVELQHKSFCGR
jgi:hypothetical protein